MSESAILGGIVDALFDRMGKVQAEREKRVDAFLAEMYALDREAETLRGMISEGLEAWRREREAERQYQDDLDAIRAENPF